MITIETAAEKEMIMVPLNSMVVILSKVKTHQLPLLSLTAKYAQLQSHIESAGTKLMLNMIITFQKKWKWAEQFILLIKQFH